MVMIENSVFGCLISLCNKSFGLCKEELVKHPDTEEEWVRLFELSTVQRMLPVAMFAAESLPEGARPTGRKIVPYYMLAEKEMSKYVDKIGTLKQLANLFGRCGIDMMLLKGVSLAERYPDPKLRISSDIDYYLYGDSKKGELILESVGIASSDYYHHHTQATANGILLENHYDFFDRENHKCNRILDDEMKALAAKEGKNIRFDFKDGSRNIVYRMSPSMEAIFLMRHMSGHFMAAETELRQIYDWVLFLRDSGDKVDWPLVKDLYEKSGMICFARILIWIIHEKLRVNVACPLEPLSGKMAEKVWDDIVNPKGKDKYRRGTARYYLREAQIFLNNRWKHSLIYPSESYIGLMFNMLKLKIKLGR